MVLSKMSAGEKKDWLQGRFDRYRFGRVNNGLSDKTKMTFAVCRMAYMASVMFWQHDFLRKNQKEA